MLLNPGGRSRSFAPLMGTVEEEIANIHLKEGDAVHQHSILISENTSTYIYKLKLEKTVKFCKNGLSLFYWGEKRHEKKSKKYVHYVPVHGISESKMICQPYHFFLLSSQPMVCFNCTCDIC